MGNLARVVLFRMPSARLYFCLLIVRYMLLDMIKGKSALNARTFLHVRDKVHMFSDPVCLLGVQAVYASIDGKQPSLAKILPIRSIPTHRSNGHYVTDIKQTCLGQGLGVTITARKRQSKLMFTMKYLGHTLPGRQN